MLIVSSSVIACPVEAMTLSGNTLYVGGSGPGNYTRIQDAIDNASNGDTVYVFSGIYNELLSIEKSIQLIGEDRDNTIINASISGDNIKIISDNVVINKFTIQNSQRKEYSCIKVLSNNNTIKNINMIYNSVGINLISSSNNFISNNYFLKNGDGIYSENSNHNLITENIIDNIQFRGIILIDSIENTISYNNIMKSELSVGLQLSDNSLGTYVHHNVISENKHRNIAVYSNGNLIEFNELKFSGMGISMDINSKASYNIIRYNNISFNSLYGIFLEGSQGSMNKIYLNNVVENGRNNVIGGQNNIFDNGYPSGNYWGDYEGVDSDNDGIGDTPYQITNSDDRDNYPLMYPLGSGNLPPFKPKNPYPSNESYNVDIYTSLEWTGGDPNYNDEVTYDIYLGKTNNPSKLVSNYKDNSYYPGPLKYGEKYYWRIISRDKNGKTTMGPLWNFLTEAIEPIVWVDDDYDNSVDGWQINRFNKIQDGIDAVRQNGIVNVMNGLYSENILVFKSLTLAGENKDNVNIDGYISVKRISNVTLESFKITGANEHPGISVNDCDSIDLSEIIVKDCPDGIYLYNASHCIIENCICYDNYGYGPVPVAGTGIGIITHSNYNKIIDCICYNQIGLGGGFPTGIYVDSSNNEIIECNVYNSPIGIRLRGNNNYVNYSYITTHSWYGIEILGSNNEIFNNIILNNDRGILISSGSNNVIYQNNFIDNEKSARFLNDKRLNYWDSNYWNRPRLLPYPIFGSSLSWFFINRVVFDYNPAQEPYDIPIPGMPNNKPDILNPIPSDNQENIPIALKELSFQIQDDENDLIDWYVTTDPFIGSGSKNKVGNGIYTISVDGLQNSTTYSWTVTATDGKDTATSTFNFKTAYFVPVITDPYPSNGSTNVLVNQSNLIFSISDPQNDLMDYTVETSPNIGSKSETNVSAGRYEVPILNLDYGTVYSWYVNVTDGTNWKKEKFTFTTLPKEILIFYPIDDTYMPERSPEDIYGSSTNINFRSFQDGWNYRTLIKFDLSQISSNTEIFYAKLYLYYFAWKDNNPAGDNLRLYRVLEDWSEDSTNWNNQPSFSTQFPSQSIVPNSPNNWITWDVTDDVINFISGDESNFGWLLKDESNWLFTNIPIGRCYSKENGNLIPYIEIGINT